MPVARCLRTTSQVQTSTPFEHQHSTGYTYVLLTAHDNHMLHVDDSMAFGMPTADVTQAFSSTCVHHTSTRLPSTSPARQHARQYTYVC